MLKPPRNPLLLKALVIGVLAVLMLIPLGMIEGLIAERASRRAEAVASVQASFAGQQTVALPFFVWPYVEHWTEQTVDAGNRVGIKQMSESKQLVWFAEQSQATAEVAVKNDRYRGIHRVRTYESTIAISGAATWPDRSQVKPATDGRRIVWGEPRLVLPIADVRGLRGSPVVNVDGKAIRFREGTQLPMLAAGLHVPLAESAGAPTTRFSINLELGRYRAPCIRADRDSEYGDCQVRMAGSALRRQLLAARSHRDRERIFCCVGHLGARLRRAAAGTDIGGGDATGSAVAGACTNGPRHLRSRFHRSR